MSAATPIPEADREITVGSDERWREALEAWDGRLEMDRARRAAAVFGRIAARDRDPHAWAWCARAHYYLGDYAHSPKESRRLFERGASLGRKALSRDARHVPAAFWTSCCLGSYAEKAGMLRGALIMPEVARYLMRVHQTDPEYYHHGLARYLGQAFMRQPVVVERFVGPAFPDLKPERILEDLRHSVEKDPPFALTLQTLGQVAHCFRKDRRTVREMLERLDRLDPDECPNLAPENQRDLSRARERLEALV